MPLSYDGGLLDHLGEHMLYLSTTPSFWYSLNSSYDHGFHLSHRLGMPPLDYERLLAAANLAHYHPKWGFTILVDRWKMFLDGHHFCSSNGIGSFEVDTKRLDFDAFILGRIKQQSFRQCVEQSKWNYLLEKEDEDGEEDEDDSEDDEDDSDVDSKENAINSHTTINKKANTMQCRRLLRQVMMT